MNFPGNQWESGFFYQLKCMVGIPNLFFHEVYGCFSLFSYVFMAHFLSNMSCLFIPKQGEKRVAQPPPTLFIQMPWRCSSQPFLSSLFLKGDYSSSLSRNLNRMKFNQQWKMVSWLVECVRLGCSPFQDASHHQDIPPVHFFSEEITVNLHFAAVTGWGSIPNYTTRYWFRLQDFLNFKGNGQRQISMLKDVTLRSTRYWIPNLLYAEHQKFLSDNLEVLLSCCQLGHDYDVILCRFFWDDLISTLKFSININGLYQRLDVWRLIKFWSDSSIND